MLGTINGTEFNRSCSLNIGSSEHGTLKNRVLGVLHWRAQISEQFWPKSFKLNVSHTYIY